MQGFSISLPLALAAAAVCLPFLVGCRGGGSSPTSTPATTSDTATMANGDAATTTTGELAPVAAGDSPDATDAEMQADVRAANAFAIKVYAQAKPTAGNFMLSGTSLRRALSAAYFGARGQTASEMARTLEVAADVERAAAAAKTESAAWQRARGTEPTSAELVIADRLWPDKSFALESAYAKRVEDTLGASVLPLDFVYASEKARTTVNGWVAEKTSDKIKDLLPSGSVNSATRLVITNAIYFKGKWALPFSKNATKDESFTSAPGKTTTTPMMHAAESHRFAEASGAKALEMRYGGGDLAMLVLLPNDTNGIGKLEDDVAKNGVDGWTKNLALTRVNITLPKFTFESGGSMTLALKALGMKGAFMPNADFSGIAKPRGTERVYVSEVVQKTWVSVDEEGTEAAAATGIIMRTTSMPMGPVVEFKATHPFLFFIRDSKTGRILFMGRVENPKG